MQQPEQIEHIKFDEWSIENDRILVRSQYHEAFASKEKEVASIQENLENVEVRNSFLGPYERHGDRYYCFLRDHSAGSKHYRGFWWRTIDDRYPHDQHEWAVNGWRGKEWDSTTWHSSRRQLLFDLDKFAEAEGKNWQWVGFRVLDQGFHRAMVILSEGGSDINTMVEVDLETGGGVVEPEDGGFRLPLSFNGFEWIDENTADVLTTLPSDFDPTSPLATSLKIRRWERRTRLEDAPVVFEGENPDIWVANIREHGWNFFVRASQVTVEGEIRTNKKLYAQRENGNLVFSVEKPDDGSACPFFFTTPTETLPYMLVKTYSPWKLGETEHDAKSLIAFDLGSFCAGDLSQPQVVFNPTENIELQSFEAIKSHLIMRVFENGFPKIHIATPGKNWTTTPFDIDAPQFANIDIISIDYHSNEFFVSISSLEIPYQAMSVKLLDGPDEFAELEVVVQRELLPIDTTHDMIVEELIAISQDVTPIPYLITRQRNSDMPRPALMSVYGAFGIGTELEYPNEVRTHWLRHGGIYVVPNTRGGGGFLTAWHKAGRGAHKYRAWEDIAAVSDDLVRKNLTTPRQLGITGCSAGGLATCVMMTKYPEKFGAIVSMAPLTDMTCYADERFGKAWIPEFTLDWEILREYSPVHNIEDAKDRKYPPHFVFTTSNDDRLRPSHAHTFVKELRKAGHEPRFFEFKYGGHSFELADEDQAHFNELYFGFLWRHLGEGAGPERTEWDPSLVDPALMVP